MRMVVRDFPITRGALRRILTRGNCITHDVADQIVAAKSLVDRFGLRYAQPAMTAAARLLLADDEDAFRNSVSVLLRREGYQCDVASNAGEAVAQLTQHPYDLLITDLRMPGNDELQLLKAAGGSLPVIVVTAYPSVPTAIEALRFAVVDYLVKPFDFDDLLHAVRRALETRKAARLLESLRTALSDGSTVAQIARRAAAPANGDAADTLTPREREIVAALSSGQRVGVIASRLGVSEHTVRNHLKAVYRKLDVHSQVELLSRWRSQPRT
jgi:DNA-binding NarL/FixJ family response regulator